MNAVSELVVSVPTVFPFCRSTEVCRVGWGGCVVERAWAVRRGPHPRSGTTGGKLERPGRRLISRIDAYAGNRVRVVSLGGLRRRTQISASVVFECDRARNHYHGD